MNNGQKLVIAIALILMAAIWAFYQPQEARLPIGTSNLDRVYTRRAPVWSQANVPGTPAYFSTTYHLKTKQLLTEWFVIGIVAGAAVLLLGLKKN